MAALFWGEDRPPTLKEYPKVLFRAALGGALVGPILSFALTALFAHPLAPIFAQWPKILLYSAYAGSVFTLSFFVCCGLPWTYLRPILADYPAKWKRVLTPIIGALGAMLAYSIATGLISFMSDFHMWGRDRFGRMLAIEALIGALLALIIGTYKSMQKQIRSTEAILHEKELRERSLSETAARAQARALQAQINPHFFFNTLNTLSALIPINPGAAQEMIGRLADMFRYTLACSRDGQVTLTQELAFIENYLELEKARFSDRLRITMPEGQFNDIQVPGLSLQPLVENAIKHGISKRIEGGEVNVSVHRNGKQCSVEVVNPAEPTAAAAEFFREGHALSIVRERLALHSGSVKVGTDEPGRVRVSLLVPIGVPA